MGELKIDYSLGMAHGKDFANYEKVSGVYMIINKENWRVYVGSSKNIRLRWLTHLRSLNAGIHFNERLQNDWNRMGNNYFKYVLLEEVDRSHLLERERYWIEEKQSLQISLGYNMKSIGESAVGTTI